MAIKIGQFFQNKLPWIPEEGRNENWHQYMKNLYATPRVFPLNYFLFNFVLELYREKWKDFFQTYCSLTLGWGDTYKMKSKRRKQKKRRNFGNSYWKFHLSTSQKNGITVRSHKGKIKCYNFHFCYVGHYSS